MLLKIRCVLSNNDLLAKDGWTEIWDIVFPERHAKFSMLTRSVQ